MNTPIAFLIFNRPESTARVFEKIRQARPSQLLIIADGPRAELVSDQILCKATRAMVEKIDWPCYVQHNYAERNMGCKQRLATGLDWVFSVVEEAIILEDDCLPGPDFFQFCEEMLDRYRDDEKVMMIQGTNAMTHISIGNSYFFSRYFAIWGWATWRRAWDGYDVNIATWPEKKKALSGKNWYYSRTASEHFENLFDKVFAGEIDTWDYQWFYHCLMNNGMSVVPIVNLISNIGDEGTHISVSRDGHNPFLHMEVAELSFPLEVPRSISPNMDYDESLLRVIAPGILVRIKRRLSSYFR